MDDTTNLKTLKQLVIDFRQARDWEKHYTPKDTAISIALEAAELLEHYQWDTMMKEDKEEIASELADILIFCFHFATLYDFDISTIFQAKLVKAAKKYPVSVFNKDSAAGVAEFKQIKRAYRQGKEQG
ncbi:MAG: nucleotide pyrophosphohydrolase [Patescibacteria group bacterium]|nr:nucleotide pyrophosphohydrolase [Patescibacteria group bacterium]